MADKSGIEWTEATWNPVVGCAHVSPGCDGCYAARETAGRLAHLPLYSGLAVRTVNGPRFTGEVRTYHERLDQPSRWKRPRRIFVNSMSDLFHRDIPKEFVAAVFSQMMTNPRHTFQVLTKRPREMKHLLSPGGWLYDYFGGAPWAEMRNIHLGVSIENDSYAWRANWLRETPAAVRWISAEPLLGGLPSLNLDGIDWLVVGGESGPMASTRPMHPAWAAQLRDAAVAADVPFLFKQWGAWQPIPPILYWGSERQTLVRPDGSTYNGPIEDLTVEARQEMYPMEHVGAKIAGRMLDGRFWDEYPR